MAAGEALGAARGALRRYRFHLREKLDGLLPEAASRWASDAGAQAAEVTRRRSMARAKEAAGPGDPSGMGVRLGDILRHKGSSGAIGGGGRGRGGGGASSGGNTGGSYDVDEDVQGEGRQYDPAMTAALLLGPRGSRAGVRAADGPRGDWAENPNVVVNPSELARASSAIRAEEAEDESWLDALAQVPTVRAWFSSQADSMAREAKEEMKRAQQQIARLQERLSDAEHRIGPAVESARRNGVSSAGLKVRYAAMQERAAAAEERLETSSHLHREQEQRAEQSEARARELGDRLDRTSRELREKQAALKAASRAHLSIAEAAEHAQFDDEDEDGARIGSHVYGVRGALRSNPSFDRKRDRSSEGKYADTGGALSSHYSKHGYAGGSVHSQSESGPVQGSHSNVWRPGHSQSSRVAQQWDRDGDSS